MSARLNFTLSNACAENVAEIPHFDQEAFHEIIAAALSEGLRLSALFGVPSDYQSRDRKGAVSPEPFSRLPEQLRLIAVLANSAAGNLALLSTTVGKSYPALTPACPQAHLFEREIAEQWGVRPEGHPWLKGVRFPPNGKRSGGMNSPATEEFYRMDGEEVHEVAVGPVHAGIIEPGHFRFQCQGERVYHLEIALGYQHRGVERALLGGPNPRSLHYAETLAGDTTAGHATAYCQVLEALADTTVPARAQALRGIALELERLANHTGDLGALAGDVGFLPTASFCGRIRGDFLNITAQLCGNRFSRGLIRPGGVGYDVDPARIQTLLERLDQARRDVTVAVNLLWDTPSVMARFEDTGRLTPKAAQELGLVGPAARACGLEQDVRFDLPAGIYSMTHIPISTSDSGDVFARAYVRWLEIQRSLAFIQEQLKALPDGNTLSSPSALEGQRVAVALVEGWRGEICHVALTGTDGRLTAYKIVDPSFHNWPGLALALRKQQISDFPLCNKSFNLSYCGHDL